MKNNEYRFTLEPYSSKRGYKRCPRCGELSYTLYIDNETGKHIDESVGMCRRSNNCGHHHPPKEYFNQLKENKMETTIVNVASEVVKPKIDHITDERWNKFLRDRTFSRQHNDRGALQSYLITLWGKDAEDALEDYDMLLSRDFVYNQKYGTVFPQIDINGVRRNAKVMAYRDNGRRLHENEKCVIWQWSTKTYENSAAGGRAFLAGKNIMRDHEFQAKQCFFGEHLLAKYPDKPVAIPESEKTCAIGRIVKPEYVWIATGGKYGCRWYDPEVYKVLKGRQVILFPDLGAESDWEANGRILAMDGIDVSIFSLEDTGRVTDEDRANGLDIADYFTRLRLQEHPELAEQHSAEPESLPDVKKASAPTIVDELSKLSPAPAPEQASEQSIEEAYHVDMDAIFEMDNPYQKKDEQPAATPASTEEDDRFDFSQIEND